MTQKESAWLREPLWIPDIRLSRAAALAVPADTNYRDAIYDKVVELLEAAGKKAAKAAVQAYLERDEVEILALDFPLGWADAILATNAVSCLVMMGDPSGVVAVNPGLVAEMMEHLHEFTLEDFLAAIPDTGGLD